ncbi:hypothetical protein LWI29_012794 [Acer saccharum]|uniref:Uncharacterized protein n=1 Tax=Acer saccharum TaxID=4024 RepID=A0AA39S542_ACESA|nr:hypothetical protein LWI29_012794 [Acer saccharum]
MRPIREMLVCVEISKPEIAAAAPIVPPLPVIPDITPSDQITRLSIGHTSLRWEKMEPTKEAMPAAPMSDCVSLSFTDDGAEWRDEEGGEEASKE